MNYPTFNPSKRNSINEMVDVLSTYGELTENEIFLYAFGYIRKVHWQSNKKFADMLRRGFYKGIIDRRMLDSDEKILYPKGTQYVYFLS